MAIADDVLAEVAKLKSAVELAVALINNLRAEVNTAGLTVEQAQAAIASLQTVETALNAAITPPA